MACGLSRYAKAAHECGHRAKLGAFFRSTVATTYTVCIELPSNRRLCVRNQEAEAGVTYVNRITSAVTGWHRVNWYVAGRRIAWTFWRR